MVRAQGPEWAVFCDDSWMDRSWMGPSAPAGGAQAAQPGGSADCGAYRTVLQVLDMSPEPLDTGTPREAGASREPPAEPGRKQREYPHSSGDRNTFPPVEHPEKRNHSGGRQRVAPNDLPRDTPRRGGGR